MAHTQEADTVTPVSKKSKPLLCQVILAMALTYFTILSLLFLAGLIFSDYLRELLGHYAKSGAYSPGSFTWFAASGATLFLSALSGLVLMILNRKGGFYLFAAAVLAIMALDFFFLTFDWMRYLIHSGLFFLAGIAHFTGKCYRKTPRNLD